MNNLALFKYCQNNPEDFFDPHYMFLEKHRELDKYIKRTQKLKNKIIAWNNIPKSSSGKKVSKEILKEVSHLLTEHANYSEFSAFLNACDSNIVDVKKNLEALKKMLSLYYANRDINDKVPSEWIQAMIDKRSSSKKGSSGERKICTLLKEGGYKEAVDVEDLKKSKKGYAVFSKSSGKFSNKLIQEEFALDLFSKTQNKALDLIIKKGADYYFLEAKHMHVGGGEQSKQILELSKLIAFKTKDKHKHIVAFLDGLYSNRLLSSIKKDGKNNKFQTQREDIYKNLKNNPFNYWLNTAGFMKLFLL